jgi:hypothetical protein
MGGQGLEAHLRDLQLNLTDTRWIGKSSGAKLVLSALALKNDITGTTSGAVDNTLLGTIDAARMRRPEYWEVYSVRYPLSSVLTSTRLLRMAHSGKCGTVQRFLVIIRQARGYQRRSNKTATPISQALAREVTHTHQITSNSHRKTSSPPWSRPISAAST